MTARAPFTVEAGIAAPLLRDNIDTDALFPGPFIRTIDADHGKALFGYWRYRDVATLAEDPAFILNQGPYREARFLIAGANFGCGSSREHAVWALTGFGMRAVIAPSFADIFTSNAFKNALLPVTLPAKAVSALAGLASAPTPPRMIVDLIECEVRVGDIRAPFVVPPGARAMLLQGLDEIGLSMQAVAAIDRYQSDMAVKRPWIFKMGATGGPSP